MIQTVQQKNGYYQNVYSIAINDLLEGVDTTEINSYIFMYNDLINQSMNPDRIAFYTAERDKLQALKDVPRQLAGRYDYHSADAPRFCLQCYL